MLSNGVLVFPETGKEFLPTLRTAVFYAPRVQTLALSQCSPDMVAEWDRLVRTAPTPTKPILSRMRDYIAYSVAQAPEVAVLAKQGLVQTLDAGIELDELGLVMRKAYEHYLPWQPDERLDSLRDDYFACPPSLAENLIRMMFDNAHRSMNVTRMRDLVEMIRPPYVGGTISFAIYLQVIAMIADRRQFAVMSGSPAAERAFRLAQSLVPRVSEVAERRRLESAMSTAVITKYLPAVHDVPVTELLLIRERRRSELDDFRMAVAELSAQIDPTSSSEKLSLQFHDLFLTKIDKPLAALNKAVATSKAELLTKALRDWKVYAAATIPTVLAYMCGAPVDYAAGAAAILSAASFYADYRTERRKLINSTQWSFLLNLKKDLEHARSGA